jgi:hypothetical protein
MMTGDAHPPEFLDGARVLQFANLSRSQPTGGTRHVVDGVEVSQFAALAVARYDDEPRAASTSSTATEAGRWARTPGRRLSSIPTSR